MTSTSWGGEKARQYVALTLREKGTVCWLCGLPGADSADHRTPRSRGGAVWDLDNLEPAHRSCNYARGNRTPRGPAALIEDGQAFFLAAHPSRHPAQPRGVPPGTGGKTAGQTP